VLAPRVRRQQLLVVGGYYDLETGQVELMEGRLPLAHHRPGMPAYDQDTEQDWLGAPAPSPARPHAGTP
jgi:hypothetical protein